MGRFYLILFIFFLSSCTLHKNTVLLQSDQKDVIIQDTSYVFAIKKSKYHLKEGDILYVKIGTTDPRFSDQYNMESEAGNRFMNESGFYLYGYAIDENGEILLPVIGKIKVVELSVEEANVLIQKNVNEYLKNAIVIVRLAGYKVTVLGEVSRPGSFDIFRNNITILDVISLAGNVTEFGNSKKIKILRQIGNGTRIYEINLTDINIISSDVYFLLPNDIVYVQPLKAKSFRENIPIISLFLTSITTFLLILTYIRF